MLENRFLGIRPVLVLIFKCSQSPHNSNSNRPRCRNSWRKGKSKGMFWYHFFDCHFLFVRTLSGFTRNTVRNFSSPLGVRNVVWKFQINHKTSSLRIKFHKIPFNSQSESINTYQWNSISYSKNKIEIISVHFHYPSYPLTDWQNGNWWKYKCLMLKFDTFMLAFRWTVAIMLFAAR